MQRRHLHVENLGRFALVHQVIEQSICSSERSTSRKRAVPPALCRNDFESPDDDHVASDLSYDSLMMKHIHRDDQSLRIEDGPWALVMGSMFGLLGVASGVGAAFALMSPTARLGGVLAAAFCLLFLVIGVTLVRRGRRDVVIDATAQSIDTGTEQRSFDELAAVVIVRRPSFTVQMRTVLYQAVLRFKDDSELKLDTGVLDNNGEHTQTLAADIGALVGIEPTVEGDMPAEARTP